MHITPYQDINQLLDELFLHMQDIFSEKLVGLYLYGSLAYGDFDYKVSDIDLLAALQSVITDKEFVELEKMHSGFAKKHKAWNDRIEVQYYSLHGLKTFKTQSSKMAVISPGEPLHIVEAGKQWLTNWYFVQTYGITLFGPPPTTIIEPISKEEFVEAVREHAREWREYVKDTRNSIKYQAYAILTLCRALYTSQTSEPISKKRAAKWFKEKFPQWTPLVESALAWRQTQKEEQIDPQATFAVTQQFVSFIVDHIEKGTSLKDSLL